MLFSVIVPVYNVEKYLPQCVRSILDQDFTDFEVILVDDGSPDGSGALCDQYAKEDDRVVVIHKPNGGLSSARNAGMRAAKGDYIIFIDSDDWVDTDGFGNIARIIEKEKPEIVETAVIEEDGVTTKPEDLNFAAYLDESPFNRERAINWICNETEQAWPAWKRVCDREFLLMHKLFFREGRLQEDIDWSTRLFYYARKYSGYPKPWYHYRLKREGSISNSIKAKFITDAIEMASMDRSYRNPCDPCTVMMFDKLICAVYASINFYRNCSESDKEIVCKCMKDNKWLLKFTPQPKYKAFAAAVRVLGVRRAMDLLARL